jgi:hypothetical protein
MIVIQQINTIVNVDIQEVSPAVNIVIQELLTEINISEINTNINVVVQEVTTPVNIEFSSLDTIDVNIQEVSTPVNIIISEYGVENFFSLISGYSLLEELASIATGEVLKYTYTGGAIRFRFIAFDDSIDGFYLNYQNGVFSNLVTQKKIII